MKLIGPFTQIVTLRGLPEKGALKDEALEVIKHGGVLLHNGWIQAVGGFESLVKTYPKATVEEITQPTVLLPSNLAMLPREPNQQAMHRLLAQTQPVMVPTDQTYPAQVLLDITRY